MRAIAAADLDLAALLRPADRIVVGQATAEPLTLTRRLVRERDLPAGCTVFLGALNSDTFEGAEGLVLQAYGAVGKGARLARAGRLDVLPWHYSALSRAFADGTLRADCVLVQLAPALEGDGYNLGIANDYVLDAARNARLVIAEINPEVPRCDGAEWPSEIPIHVCVAAEHPPLQQENTTPGETELAIAEKVASLIPDRAAIQLGVGAIPQALTRKLAGHRDLGLHSGAVFDAVVDLVECGAVTNAAKEYDAGVSVGGLLLGSCRLYDFANDNRSFRLRPPAQTHAQTVFGGMVRFCAINSAIEVDLTGQVNAETVGGRYLGAVGGQVDFVRGANASPGGRAIIALPATARGGAVSRIVPRVETVTCPRSDADAIVTEWGIAELRGCTLSQRVERMIAIAAPQFRETLARQWRDVERAAYG